MSKWLNYIVPQWVDEGGLTFRPYTTVYPQVSANLSPYSSLLTALQACSACQLQACIIQAANTLSNSLGTATFPTALNKMVIQVQNSNGTGYIAFPGPADACLMGDGVTLNLSASIVATLVTEILAVLGDSQGNQWTSVVGGKRIQIIPGPGGSR